MKSKIELVVNGQIELSETVEIPPRPHAQKLHIATLCMALLGTIDAIEKQEIESSKDRED